MGGVAYFGEAFPTTFYTTLSPGEYTMWEGEKYNENPFDHVVSGSPGDSGYNAVDIQTGELLWQVQYGDPRTAPTGGWNGTHFTEGYIGLDGTHSRGADGKIIIVEKPGRHSSSWVTSSNIKSGMIHPSIDFLWRPGYVYCFGAGPTQFTNLVTDKVQLKAGEPVTISGSVVDLSPYNPGVPAVHLPVHLTYVGPDDVRYGIMHDVYTDSEGKFSYTWAPWVTGTLAIRAESPGSAAYESPDNAYTPIYVQSALDLVPILEGALIAAIIVAVALPIIILRTRKPKP